MRRAILLAAALGVVLTGCSSPGPTGPPPTTAPSRASTTAAEPVTTLTVTSTAFTDGTRIPGRYTCAGGGEVPTIAWTGNLRGTAALAVVVDDPDAPGGTFVHRIVVDLPPTTTSLAADVPAGAHQARNSAGQSGWTAPCPPS